MGRDDVARQAISSALRPGLPLDEFRPNRHAIHNSGSCHSGFQRTAAHDAASEYGPARQPCGRSHGWYFDTPVYLGVGLDVALAASCPFLDSHT
jgi:hypothetical protein